jgi:hypothetical protein
MSVNVNFTIAGPEANKLRDRIREEAKSKGVSLSEFITEAVVYYLRNHTVS